MDTNQTNKRSRGQDPVLVVIWQSLVVKSYRSFFYQLAEQIQGVIALVAPHEFEELGRQRLRCAPFDPPFSETSQRTMAFCLRVVCLHVQWVVYVGLTSLLRKIRVRVLTRDKRQRYVVLAMTEPYAPTCLLNYCAARFALGRNLEFYCFALQNITKDFRWPLRLIQNFIFRRCKGILYLGAEQKKVLSEQGYQGPLHYFPLWFDESLFYFRTKEAIKEHLSLELNRFSDRYVLGFCGALSPEKGLEDLLDALKTHPSRTNLALVVAGRGPLRQYLEDRLLELEKAGVATHYCGPLDSESMPFFFSAIDLLCVPSRTESHWKEQFGRVIIESLAVGTRVIGSDSGAIAEVIGEDPLLGTVFPERDIAALARTIERIAREGKATSEDREQRRAIILARYGAKTLATNFARELNLTCTEE